MRKELVYLFSTIVFNACMLIMPDYAHAFHRDGSPATGSRTQRADSGAKSYYDRSDVKEALNAFHRAKEIVIRSARDRFNKKEFAESARLYQQAEAMVPNLPDVDPTLIKKSKGRLSTEYGEWGDALSAMGKTTETIEVYRNAVYTPRPLSMFGSSDKMAPINVLPEGITEIEEAKQRFPQTMVQMWLSTSPSVLSRYALLLVESGRYEEAILVYDRALKNLANETYEPVLGLGNISVTNFDKKRFIAALHVMFALEGDAEIWYGYYKPEDMKEVREDELKKALAVYPNYVPAMLAYVDKIVSQRQSADPEKRQLAKAYLEKAESYARGDAQRDLARQKRATHLKRLAQ